MHHPLIRFSAAVCTAAVLCGCSMYGAVRIEKEPVEYETDSAKLYAEKLKFSGIENKSTEDSLNSEYFDGINSRLVEFESMTADAGELLGGNKCVFEIRRDVKYNKNNFISIVEEEYIYTGGAHGQTVRRADNIDLLTGESLSLADLFADEGYKDTLNRLINEEVRKNPEKYSDLWEQPQIKDSNQSDFYLTDNALVIFYQPYDLSYYARGFVEFELDLADLNGYLSSPCRRLSPAAPTD